MQYFRHPMLLPLIFLTGSLLFPVFAACQQPQPPAKQAAAPPPPPKADPKADEIFKQALDHLDQRPRFRLYADVIVKLGNMDGQMLTVSDGTAYWSRMRIGDLDKGVNKWDVKAVQAALKAPGMDSRLLDEFYKNQAFLGLLPLLQSLRQQMVFIRQEHVSFQGREMQKVTGVWSPDVSRAIAPPNSPWPPLVPQKCAIYFTKLEGKVEWPYRIEWWGPLTARGEDTLLLQMEFRDPKILKADSPDAKSLMQVCTFNPGTSPVMDRTKDITGQLGQIQAMQEKAKADKDKAAPPPTPGK
jgi:hypothetical protein